MHNDKILHYLSLLKAPLAVFDEDDSLLLSRIPSLMLKAASAQHDQFATQLMELFGPYPAYGTIGRCCLAKRLGAANTLFVLSAQQTQPAADRMRPGYFCYVKPNSTLLQLKPSDIRTFNKAQDVVQSFIDEGDPPQRTIKRVAEAGFVSGVCLPLFAAKKNRGYLFLNSHTTSLFQLRPVDYSILSYLGLVATSILADSHQTSSHYDWLADQLPETYLGDFLQADRLSAAIMQHSKALHVPLEIKNCDLPSQPFLVSHGSIANIISRFVRLTEAQQVSIAAAETENQLEFSIELAAGEMPDVGSYLLQSLVSDCSALEMKLRIRGKRIELSVLKDLGDGNPRHRYSI